MKNMASLAHNSNSGTRALFQDNDCTQESSRSVLWVVLISSHEILKRCVCTHFGNTYTKKGQDLIKVLFSGHT